MRSFSYLILIILILSIIMEPFTETMIIYVEKAKLDSAAKNAGRLSIEKCIGDHDRSLLKTNINEDEFIKNFNNYFADALDLTLVESNGGVYKFRSENKRFNSISTSFDILSKNECHVKISSRYKYKTKYLKLADSASNGLLSYNLEVEEPFFIKIRN